MNNTKTLFEPEIEQYVLGSIILDNPAFDKANLILSPDSFSDIHKLIFESMESLYREGKPIDTLSLYEDLKKRNLINEIGGAPYLSKLSNYASSAENIEYHSKILADKWMLRRLLKIKDRLAHIEINSDPFEIIAEISNDIYKIENSIIDSGDDKELFASFKELMEEVEQKYTGELSEGIKSNTFPSFNKATGGIMQTDLVVIYGLEKQGKSYLSEKLAVDFALQGFRIGAFTMEMNFKNYANRAFGMLGNLEFMKLRNPKGNGLTTEEFHSYYKATDQKIHNEKVGKVYIDDKTRDFEKIISRAKLWKRKYDINLLVIDYLGLIASRKKFERTDLKIAYFTQSLKALAVELETPVIVVSQANDNERTADSKGALRDCDFALRVFKPVEIGIKSTNNNSNDSFIFNENHFVVTIERSRYGVNKKSFICAFQNNDFVELDIDNVQVI